jgi:hypothetical protein
MSSPSRNCTWSRSQHLTGDGIVSVDEHRPFHLTGTDSTSVKDGYEKIVLRSVVSLQSRAHCSELSTEAGQQVAAPCSTRNLERYR